MDKEKALNIWLPVIVDGVKHIPECKESLDMAINALKHENDIIEELENLKSQVASLESREDYINSDGDVIGYRYKTTTEFRSEVLQIIEKIISKLKDAHEDK